MTEALPRSAIEPKNPLLNASRSSNLPHVPGIRVGDYIFLSGMGPIDPQTGERIQIAASKVPRFSAGSALKKAVKGSF